MAAHGNTNGEGEVGDFAETPHSKTTPTANHPLDVVVPSLVSSSEPSLHATTPVTPVTPQVTTPRPHLFSSLEEAHLQITSRSREGSRQVSGATNHLDSGDESFLVSLSPPDAREVYTNVGFPITNVFGRSLTDSMPSQLPRHRGVQESNNTHHNLAPALGSPLPSKTEPAVHPNPASRFLGTRAFAEADISNQQPPYNSDSTVDRLIRQYGSSAQASSAAESQTVGFDGLGDSDYFIGQYDGCYESDAGGGHLADNDPHPLPLFNRPTTTRQSPQGVQASPRSAVQPSPDREARCPNIVAHDQHDTTGDQAVPSMPHSVGHRRTPFHSSNPFAGTVAQSATVESTPEAKASPKRRKPRPKSPRPLLYYGDSDEELPRADKHTKVESDSESDSEAEANNRLSKLLAPHECLHSARKNERVRRSYPNTGSQSASGMTNGESDSEDPFKYDAIFSQPSKEREVSAYLHRISGLAQDTSAIPCSPDRTPLRGTTQYLEGQPVSPTAQRLLDTTQSSSMASIKTPDQNAREQRRGQANQGHAFFDSSAIHPDWALGSPDAVRVPVRQKHCPSQEGLQGARLGGQEASQQLVLEGLRREGQNHQKTGNTED